MKLNRAVDRLASLNAQDALLLLRISFSASRVQHLLRCSPSVDTPGFETFGSLLRSALNVLPILIFRILCGCGYRVVFQLRMGVWDKTGAFACTHPAYLASAASTSDLQSQILSVTSAPLIYFKLYTVFQKNAKIEITITTTNLIRIKYPFSSFNYYYYYY